MIIKETSQTRCVQESPCQCWTNCNTDVAVAVGSSMGGSGNFKIWRLPKSWQVFSQKQNQGYELSCCAPYALFAGHSQLIGADLQRLHELSVTSIQMHLVRVTHYRNSQILNSSE